MPNNLPSINLAKNRQIPVVDKFLNWALTIGRLIIIVTEVIAVIAFVYRFSLDEKLINLHSEIKQQQNIASSLKNDEAKYRNIQDRIALASTFSAKAAASDQVITDIVKLVPNQMEITNLVLNKNRMTLDINVLSISSLDAFVESLKNYEKIKSISVDNIENKPSVGLSVNITITLK
jgi:Tfp pilus assembly protein PilO